jgi:hypothetical protein
MSKQILAQTCLMFLELFKLVLIMFGVGFIAGAIVVEGCWGASIIFNFHPLMYFLPIVFVYHILCITKLKKYICDVIYFIGFILVESFYIKHGFTFDREGIYQLYRSFVYVILFGGLAVYFSEIIFRIRKRINESGHKETFERFDWRHVSEHIFSQSKVIFIRGIRSCIITAIVIFIAASGPGFMQMGLGPIFTTKGLLCVIGLLPAIMLYHSACALKLKRRTCDTLYFAAFVVAELLFLPFAAWNVMYPPDGDYLRYLLPFYAMSVIALGGIAVYMAEVYFRNRAILKSYEKKIKEKSQEIY